MRLLTEDARLVCEHRGVVAVPPSQAVVRIEGRRVLVERDPEEKTIRGCPNAGPTIKPCTTTLVVQQGYSALLRIDDQRACLDTVRGLTDGTPPGSVAYIVHAPGQSLVELER